MGPSVLFLVDQKSPRLRYVLDIIGNAFWQQEIRWTDQRVEFKAYDGPRVAYTAQPISSTGDLWIPADPFLQENEIRSFTPQARTKGDQWQLFPTDQPTACVSFDIFSAIFYLLSRYEEYLPFDADEHQRFPANESILHKAGQLLRPVVDEWVLALRQIVENRYISWTCPKTRYSFLPSYDIDVAWAFKHRPWFRQMASAIRNMVRGDWHLEKLRWQTILNQQEDPFFTFPTMQQLHRGHEEAVLFFQVGSYGSFDKNVAPDVPAFRRLIRVLQKDFTLGLHPSYRSNEDPQQLATEVRIFSNLTNQPTQHSRQHYLKLQFPQTYRALIKQGIQVDYSLGFADDIGFRAGIGRPFRWYDLEREAQTELKLVPFMAMDVTLLQKGEPEHLKPQIFAMIERTRAVGGQFCTLWHNNTLSNLAPFAPNWSAFYQEVLSEARRSF
ncbi:MAG: polysaccharide deacetylase family protein [Bacteroidota bacterium]